MLHLKIIVEKICKITAHDLTQDNPDFWEGSSVFFWMLLKERDDLEGFINRDASAAVKFDFY